MASGPLSCRSRKRSRVIALRNKREKRDEFPQRRHFGRTGAQRLSRGAECLCLRANRPTRPGGLSRRRQDQLCRARLHPGVQGAARISRARLGHEEFRRHRQAAASQGPPAEGAAGLQDRQYARRHRRLRRYDAPRDRRPAGRLELRRRPDAGLGRYRYRPLRMPDTHRAAVPGAGLRHRAAAEPRQELGLVRRRP
ncbi:hypothetical protein ACVIEM_005672 [Rhizobium leguminosarum]